MEKNKVFLVVSMFWPYYVAMATKNKQTAAAHVIPARALTIACSGTEKIGEILANFGCIREGKSVITLRVEVDSSVRMDTVPARVTAPDWEAVLTDSEQALVERAEQVKAAAKDRAKQVARKRVGNGTREVWSSKVSIKRHVKRG